MGFAKELYTREYFTSRDADGNKLHYGAVGAEEWEAGSISVIHRTLIDQIPLIHANVLEIGYGRAESARYLLSTGKAASYVGVDFSEAAHDLARTTLKDFPANRWSVHCDDALPFLMQKRFTAAFDAVLMLDVIEHIPQTEVQSLLPLLHAALLPGGFIIVNTPFYLMDEDYIAQNYEYIMPSPSDLIPETRGMHCNKFTEQRLQREFAEAGFSCIGPALFRQVRTSSSPTVAAAGSIAEPRQNTKCAIVIPVGPGHEGLSQQAIASVQAAAQTDPGPFTDFDCLLIDDTAGTKGRSAARNEGVRKAAERGADWLFLLDADDLMTPNAFQLIESHVNRADALWGLILEGEGSTADKGTVTGSIRTPQLPRIQGLPDLLLHDPFMTLQMGHFVRTDVALANPFDETMDVGEDFDYYLRIWESARCLKIPAPLFLNRRGLHSSGPRSATGADWRVAVERVLDKARQAHGLVPTSPLAIDVRNAATLDTRMWQRNFGLVEPGSLFGISRQFPYHGFVPVVPSIGEPFVMFDDNDDLVCMSLGWRGTYEPASLRLWQRLALNAKVVFDIGAYTGVYALMAARAAPDARVVAVEPVAANLARLAKNRDANACDTILPVRAAMLDHLGEVTVHRTASRDFLTSGASVIGHRHGETTEEERVPAVTGAELLTLTGELAVDLVKIDVEGAEEQVLAGMADLLDRCGPDLLIECLDEEAAGRVDGILRAHGYRFHAIDDNALSVTQTERFTAATGMHSLNRWATKRSAGLTESIVRAAGLSFVPHAGSVT
ncbi:FkbM family methyltransferase [Azospirillum sp.]|uniref:FkbM family methyltransferase n=1 Tax=Azospirillum sp. TaxID=34012 RepID=UPI002D4F885B|nr:FkbM family methyltransferase [Azospirillum sp.]HYD68944.1 FkbM family methyltransferase [Azospirillum sp.]